MIILDEKNRQEDEATSVKLIGAIRKHKRRTGEIDSKYILEWNYIIENQPKMQRYLEALSNADDELYERAEELLHE